MTSATANAAAVVAALEEAADKALPLPIAVTSRRMSKVNGRPAVVGSLPSPPASLPTHKFPSVTAKLEMGDSAIDDDALDFSGDERDVQDQKPRVRRASDGTPLTKEGRKQNRVELRCEKCGKGYKHSSCLTKHLFVYSIYNPCPCLPACQGSSIEYGKWRVGCAFVLTRLLTTGGNTPRNGR
jgi:hypothetical protein